MGSGESLDALTKDYSKLLKTQADAEGKAYAGFSRQTDEGYAKLSKMADKVGVESQQAKPWNEEEESKKYSTDPVAAFGSLGSVFGILASAFTHQPFYTAMTASAAAINAVKEGDAAAYDRASKAWKDNTKLALDRAKIEQEQYKDAVELFKTNMAAGEAKIRMLAARFGDQKVAFLAEHGMNKEIIDLFEYRQKTAEGLEENQIKLDILHAEISTLYAPRVDPDTGKTIKFDP